MKTNSQKKSEAESATAGANEAAPRLPHEHDESSDSQGGGPRPVIEQARRDLESGQEDTDLRGSRGRRYPSIKRRDKPDR